jgi:hypothetical protein
MEAPKEGEMVDIGIMRLGWLTVQVGSQMEKKNVVDGISFTRPVWLDQQKDQIAAAAASIIDLIAVIVMEQDTALELMMKDRIIISIHTMLAWECVRVVMMLQW